MSYSNSIGESYKQVLKKYVEMLDKMKYLTGLKYDASDNI